jgi:hypothetical protein
MTLSNIEQNTARESEYHPKLKLHSPPVSGLHTR